MTATLTVAFDLDDLAHLVGDDLDGLLSAALYEALPFGCEGCGARTDEDGADWDWHGHRCSPECAPRCGDCWERHLDDGGHCLDED